MLFQDKGLSTRALQQIQQLIQTKLDDLKQDRKETQTYLGGGLAVDTRIFMDCIEKLVQSENRIKQLEEAISYLQKRISGLELTAKSRNISTLEEKTADIRSRNIGRKSHDEMIKELGLDGTGK